MQPPAKRTRASTRSTTESHGLSSAGCSGRTCPGAVCSASAPKSQSPKKFSWSEQLQSTMNDYTWKNLFTKPALEKAIKEITPFGQGKAESVIKNGMVCLLFVMKLLEHKKTTKSSSSETEPWKKPMNEARTFVAKSTGCDDRTAGKIIIHWIERHKQGESGVPPARERKPGSGLWKRDGSLWEDRFSQEAKKFIDERRLGKDHTGTTAKDIVMHLKEKFGGQYEGIEESERIEFSEALVRYHLRVDLGLRFGKLFPQGPNLNSDKHHAHMLRFLDLFDAALKLEIRREAILVWLDESYINIGSQYLWGWFNPEDPGTRKVASKSKGLRIIALDAIVKEKGRLRVPGCDDKPRNEWPKSTEEFKNCLMIWPQGTKKSAVTDYHRTMDGSMFLRWIEKRLIPTFMELYPGMRCILMLDNAGYHKVWTDGQFPNLALFHLTFNDTIHI